MRCPCTLGRRGDVTVGMGGEALLCVADRDVTTGIIIPGRFSQRIPLDAAALLPGGVAAATSARAASLLTSKTRDPDGHALGVFPSCVFSGGGRPKIDDRSVRDVGVKDCSAVEATTVRVTFPAAALAGCALRCRVNGRALPISIVSASRDAVNLTSLHREMETMTLVVNIAAAEIDGVAMLELVRSSSHESGGSMLEQSLNAHLHPLDNREDLSGNAQSAHALHAMAGVPVGVPATPVLLVSNPDVFTALKEVLALEDNVQGDCGLCASTRCAVGAIILRGTAPTRQAFQFACWAASKGQTGRALTIQLLDMYPAASMITSKSDAASYLLHAAASGNLETVLAALYCCQEAAEGRGFDASELATFPAGTDGETALHRAAALHERGGDADMMYELLATLAKPQAWSMSLQEGPQIVSSTMLNEAVGCATATLVRIVRRSRQSMMVAATPIASEIIREAISECPFPVGATPYESARTALTLEIFHNAGSATRLLNVVIDHVTNSAADSCIASGFSTPDHDDSISSTNFPMSTAVATCAVAACETLPTLGRMLGTRAFDVYHAAWEGTMGGVRRFEKVKSWLERFGPDGSASLFFHNDSKLERMWMNSRSRTQTVLDHMAFTFMGIFLFIDLFKNQVPAATTAVEFMHHALFPCFYTVFFIFVKVFPSWYVRHRETIIFVSRLGACMLMSGNPSTDRFPLAGASQLRQFSLFFTLNIFPCFYAIRADRHLFLQVANTLVIVVSNRGESYTADNLPLRSSLAGASLLITVLLELQSRRAFTLEHAQTQASKQTHEHPRRQGKGAEERGDWYEWGSSNDHNADKPVPQ